jgi:hypothetical protein
MTTGFRARAKTKSFGFPTALTLAMYPHERGRACTCMWLCIYMHVYVYPHTCGCISTCTRLSIHLHEAMYPHGHFHVYVTLVLRSGAEFSYSLWAIVQNFVKRYRPPRRIIDHSTKSHEHNLK